MVGCDAHGLIGPNGSGKTTLLRLLAGLLRPDSGTLRVAGWDVASEPAAVRRELGVLTESQGLYARLTVREHLRYAGELRGLRGQRLERRIDELLALFELDGLAHRRTAGFSRGQQARLSLARATLHQPRILLLDEPTSASTFFRRGRYAQRCEIYAATGLASSWPAT